MVSPQPAASSSTTPAPCSSNLVHWSKRSGSRCCETPIHKAIKFTQQINEAKYFTDGPWLRQSATLISFVYFVVGVVLFVWAFVRPGSFGLPFWLVATKGLFHIVTSILVRVVLAIDLQLTPNSSPRRPAFVVGLCKFTIFLLVVGMFVSLANIVVHTGIAVQCVRSDNGLDIAHPWIYGLRKTSPYLGHNLRGGQNDKVNTVTTAVDLHHPVHQNCDEKIGIAVFFWVLQLFVVWKEVLFFVLLRKWVVYVRHAHGSVSIVSL